MHMWHNSHSKTHLSGIQKVNPYQKGDSFWQET